MQKKLRLKPFVIPTVYTILVIALLIGTYISSRDLSKEEDNYQYVSSIILDNEIPVMNLETTIMRPYSNNKVTIAKDFYDNTSDEKQQQNSIIYHENTYMQNSGVDYTSVEEYDVQSILDGEVIDISEEELLGTVVTIRHTNDIVSIYQSLSNVSVKKNETVTRGQIIGKSGTCELNKDIANHLHFELSIKGQIVDPENYFDKKLSDLQ